jgi:hypothetical protein
VQGSGRSLLQDTIPKFESRYWRKPRNNVSRLVSVSAEIRNCQNHYLTISVILTIPSFPQLLQPSTSTEAKIRLRPWPLDRPAVCAASIVLPSPLATIRLQDSVRQIWDKLHILYLLICGLFNGAVSHAHYIAFSVIMRTVLKSAGHVAWMGVIANPYRLLVGKS